jgi:hypothetical protein
VKRWTTLDHLEQMAWDNGRLIEFDYKLGAAILKVSGRTWFAPLDEDERAGVAS